MCKKGYKKTNEIQGCVRCYEYNGNCLGKCP